MVSSIDSPPGSGTQGSTPPVATRPTTGRLLAVGIGGGLAGALLWTAAASWTLLQTGAYSMLVAAAVVVAMRRFATPLSIEASGRAAAVAAFATLLGCVVALPLSIAGMFAASHDVSLVRVYEALSLSYQLDTLNRFLSWYDAAFGVASLFLAALGVASAAPSRSKDPLDSKERS